MPSRSSLHDAGDLEMDSFNPSEPQSASIHRPLRRSEGIPKFQFPTHDVRPQMPPRRMESDVLDMDDYGLREPQSSYDMRSAPLPSPAGRLRRSDQYDNSDVDMMNGFDLPEIEDEQSVVWVIMDHLHHTLIHGVRLK
ncbi:unnamed protein product [Trichobilharzia regenti]|nr:unnamed protein product [Trichobilharzia regenti]